MALVTITGFVWSHGRAPIPAVQQPRLWFRPDKADNIRGLQHAQEVQATVTSGTGAFTVELESFNGMTYTPVLDWLLPGQETEAPQNRARGYEEWPSIYPGEGGDISALNPFIGTHGLMFGFGNPPSYLNNVVYLDITGPAIRIYGPAGGTL